MILVTFFRVQMLVKATLQRSHLLGGYTFVTFPIRIKHFFSKGENQLLNIYNDFFFFFQDVHVQNICQINNKRQLSLWWKCYVT